MQGVLPTSRLAEEELGPRTRALELDRHVVVGVRLYLHHTL